MDKEKDCPNAANHTPCPDGYMQRIAWVDRMEKTHKATRCPGCGKWVVWAPRLRKVRASGE